MILKTFRIYQYNLPLTEPVSIKGHFISSREGIVIHLQTDDGYEGFGEIAPLPGLSKETLADALAQVKKLKKKLVGQTLPKQLEKLDGKFEVWLKGFSLKPSVRFGIETAVLNLIAHSRKKSLNQLLSDSHHEQIKINALLNGNKEDVKKQARQLVSQGFVYLKLKVGPNIREEAEKIMAVNEILGDKAALHLDANQTWDLNKAVELGETIGCAAVLYIEEPLKNLKDIPEFFMKTTIPVALDESLIDKTLEDIKSIEGVDIIVLKPTILGGIERVWMMMQQARRVAIDCVLSSSFETSLGLLTIAQLAGSSQRDSTAGLDTFKWFKQDLLKHKLTIEHGKLNIKNRMIHSQDIDFSLLKEV